MKMCGKKEEGKMNRCSVFVLFFTE